MYKKTLSITESTEIVKLVSNILSQPRLQYGYSLSELEPYTRIDVNNAFKLEIAKIYKKDGIDALENINNSKMIDSLYSTLFIISETGIPDSEIKKLDEISNIHKLTGLATKWSLTAPEENTNPSFKAELAIFNQLNLFDSNFTQYCKSLLKENSTNYWRAVYEEIGLDYQKYIENLRQKHKHQSNNNTSCLNSILILVVLSMLVICLFKA